MRSRPSLAASSASTAASLSRSITSKTTPVLKPMLALDVPSTMLGSVRHLWWRHAVRDRRRQQQSAGTSSETRGEGEESPGTGSIGESERRIPVGTQRQGAAGGGGARTGARRTAEGGQAADLRPAGGDR